MKKTRRQKTENSGQRAPTDNSPGESLIRKKMTDSFFDSFRLFRSILTKGLRSPDQAVEKLDTDILPYIFNYIYFYTIGLAGILIYALAGGSRYFNVRFLFLIPTVGAFIGFLIFCAAGAVLYFTRGVRGFTRNKIGFLKYLAFCFLLTPAAYLFYPIKIWIQEWKWHSVLIQTFIALYFLVIVYSRSSQYIKKINFLYGFVLTAIPFLLCQIFSFEIAKFVIEKLRL